MNDTLLKLLRQVDTPTVCNAIEVAQGKRGFDAFTRGTMLASHPDAPAMVGYARTARIAVVAPPTEAPDVIRARRMAYYRHMAEGPRPAVAVVEDMDFPFFNDTATAEIYTLTLHDALPILKIGALNIFRLYPARRAGHGELCERPPRIHRGRFGLRGTTTVI